jgi:hypothetical protein
MAVFFKELQKCTILPSLVGQLSRFLNRPNHPTKASLPTDLFFHQGELVLAGVSSRDTTAS